MKRIYLSIVALCVWAFSLHAQNGEFDPANPGDPMPYYALTVHVSPSAGGTANITRTMAEEGQQVSLRITPAKDFKLSQWVCGDSVLGTDSYQYFTMPARNVVITAQMVYEPEAFNPPSPDDPQGQGEVIRNHQVTVYTSPSVGGSVNRSLFYMQEGAQERIYAYPNAGYEFVGWYIGDRLESNSNPVTLMMHESDVTFTARFQFNPSSPEDPGANLYDAATGTLIIDRFTPGNLSNIVYNLVDNSNYNNVKSVIIKGEMSTDDYGVLNDFPNAEVIDISQTTGYTSIPSWAFENMTKLSRLLLPTTVETIGSEAFYGCSALSEIVIYAPAPPALASYASDPFEGVDNGLVVRVPASSVSLYQANTLWGNFIILPMDVQSLNVTLPEDKVSLYENMFLELLDTKSGQLRRYVITNRNAYSFEGMFNETSYQLTLRNAQGIMFGQEMVTFAGKDTTVSFANLRQPVDISLQVLDTTGNDVTGHTIITWLDNEGKYLGKGTQLIGQAEGSIVNYKIELDEELGVLYQQPLNEARIVVNPEKNKETCVLQSFQYVNISGLVLDSATNRPIKNATIAVTQVLNFHQRKTINTTSAADGSFNFSLPAADFNISISAKDYKTQTFNGLKADDNLRITLTKLSGNTIYLSFQYAPAVVEGDSVIYQNWYDENDIVYTLHNVTKDRSIDHFETQYPRMVIQDHVEEEDEIRIIVTSRTNAFAPTQVSAIVSNQNAEVTINVTESGQIIASYIQANSDDIVSILYNSEGKRIRSYNYTNNSIKIENLQEGDYSLITMEQNDRLNSINDISTLSQVGLIQGTDFVLNSVTVLNGLISTIENNSIPTPDEGRLSYTDDNTSLTTNKTTLVAGNYLTLTAHIGLKPEYAQSIRSMQLVVPLPESVSFVENSVMVGNALGEYTTNANQLIIPITNLSDRVRFCVVPTTSGDYSMAALLQFEIDSEVKQQPIGAAHYSVTDLAITVPASVSTPSIPISGTAIANSIVKIYDNGVYVAETTSSPGGFWSLSYQMHEPYNLSKHLIAAEVITENGLQLKSETAECQYLENFIEVSTVKMYQGGSLKTTYNFRSQSKNGNSWSLNPSDKLFEYAIDFTENNPEKIQTVVLYVHMSNGDTWGYPAAYDEVGRNWKVRCYMDGLTSDYYPVNCSLDYDVQQEIRADRREFDQSIDNVYAAIEDAKQLRMIEEQKFMTDAPGNPYSLLLDSLLNAENVNDSLIHDAIIKLVGDTFDVKEYDSIAFERDMTTVLANLEEIEQWERDSAYLLFSEMINELYSDVSINFNENISFKDTIEGVCRTNITSSIDIINEQDLLDKGYAQYVLTDGNAIYLLETDSVISVIDAKNKKRYEIHTDTIVRNNIYQAPPRMPFATCFKSSTSLVKQAIVMSKKLSTSNLIENAKSIAETINESLGLIECAYVGKRLDVLASMDQLYPKIVGNYDAKILKQKQTLELSKKMLSTKLNAGMNSPESIKQLNYLINKTTTEIQVLEGNKKQAIDIFNKARNAVAETPSTIVKGAKLSRTLTVVGKISGPLGTIINLYNICQDGYESIHDINEWLELIDRINEKMPCQKSPEEAQKLYTDIMGSAIWHIGSHVGTFGAGLLATSIGATTPNLYTWCSEQILWGAAEVIKTANYLTTYNAQGQYWTRLTALQCECKYQQQPHAPERAGVMKADISAIPINRCPCEKNKKGKHRCYPDDRVLIDPSGFVYEAVENNRVQDVQATIYYKASRENIFGEMVEEEVVWDAENYGQENPLYTDAQGMYHWDVPQGLWQVRFEKDGYEPTQSEWLPVPPPQLEVNIPIVQLRQPEVANAIAHKDAIDITFDKYMMPSLLNTDNIFVTANDQAIPGTIEMLDEQHPYNDNATSYATKVRFVPATPFTASEITLTVSTRVHSYADVPLAQTFQQTFDVENAEVIVPAQAPVASIESGTVVEQGTQVALSCTTEGAVIRYTMDGSALDCQNGYIYVAPITLYGDGQISIKAIACADGYNPSEVAQWTYIFVGTETAIEEQDAVLSPSKILRDGQILIIRGDKTYTLMGQEVK